MDHKKIRMQSRHRKRSQKRSLCIFVCILAITLLAAILLNLQENRGAVDKNLYQASKSSTAANREGFSWNLLLVNRWNPIPEDYEVKLTWLKNGESVSSYIYPFLQQMFDTARKEGIYPEVTSGYRTREKQQELMDAKISAYMEEGCSYKQAQKLAETWVAAPGTSEHELGLSADINADGGYSTDEEVYEWLDENAYLFGFIRRYPSDKTDITGVSNEPWHYRFVGKEAAAEMRQKNICLEEYVSNHE